MTTFSVRLQIGDLAATRFEDVEAMVDTGSTLTAVPRELLERLGVQPTRRQRFQVANGTIVENDVGDATVRLEGVQGVTPVIFGEPGEPVLLGAVTLEAFLFGVDPVHETLIPVVGLRYSHRQAWSPTAPPTASDGFAPVQPRALPPRRLPRALRSRPRGHAAERPGCT